ncbi:hypothetical protein ScPMuIL_000035 [Solemya velum]
MGRLTTWTTKTSHVPPSASKRTPRKSSPYVKKEKGNWADLTLEEKKELYRASFCQTYAEMTAPTGEWKSVTATIIMTFVLAGWLTFWLKKFVYDDMPPTINTEWQEAQVRRMIELRMGAVEGVSAKWDYDKGEWK